ncbi:MAG: hypothetical protein H7X70_02820 [Candidatus Kapabacteria bacterium]|nr:hypothetical protein [Candidatus Kapabacteria bacterium]
MNIWFHIQGASRLLARRKGPLARMVVVAIVGTLWCLAGGIWGVAVWRDLDRRAEQMSIDIIGPADSTNHAIHAMAQDMRRRPSVKSVNVLSSDDVWSEFANEMHLESDDLREVAAVPSILRLQLLPPMVSVTATEKFIRSLEAMYPEATARIVWPRPYVEMLDAGRSNVLIFGSVAGLLSLVLFLLAVTYAFRAEIHRAGSDLKVAALLGAPNSWIAAPHLLVSIIAGAVGLGIGVGLLCIARPYMLAQWMWLGNVTVNEILIGACAIAVLGLVLCWWQSIVSVKGATRTR